MSNWINGLNQYVLMFRFVYLFVHFLDCSLLVWVYSFVWERVGGICLFFLFLFVWMFCGPFHQWSIKCQFYIIRWEVCIFEPNSMYHWSQKSRKYRHHRTLYASLVQLIFRFQRQRCIVLFYNVTTICQNGSNYVTALWFPQHASILLCFVLLLLSRFVSWNTCFKMSVLHIRIKTLAET